MRERCSVLIICLTVFLSVAGAAGFAFLFIPRMNVYWIILAPVIIAVYQIPAVIVYALWKRRRARGLAGPDEEHVSSAGENDKPPSDLE